MDQTIPKLTKCLSLVASACMHAPEDTDTKDLRGFLAKRGISGDELDAMIARKCADFGAITAALAREPAKKAAPKKKAAKKKAAK